MNSFVKMLKGIAFIVLTYFIFMETIPLGSVSAKVIYKDIMDDCKVEVGPDTDDTVEPGPDTNPIVVIPPPNNLPETCIDVYVQSNFMAKTNEVYKVQKSGSPAPIQVYCEFGDEIKEYEYISGCAIRPNDEHKVYVVPFEKYKKVLCSNGNTVLQYRYDGTQDFKKKFAEFEEGFGDAAKEHWAGLKFMNSLTSTGRWTLTVTVESFSGVSASAEYKDFEVGPSPYYVLTLGDFSGSGLNDKMNYNSGYNFSAIDLDQDYNQSKNCAGEKKAGWWFKDCSRMNINSWKYGNRVIQHYGYNFWGGFNDNEPLKGTKMMIHPLSEKLKT